jgi:hypothetical protein
VRSFQAVSIGSFLAIICCAFHDANLPKAHAAIADIGGNILVVAPPPNVVLTQFEDDKFVRLFREQSGLTLPTEVRVDVTELGVVGAAKDLTPALLPVGTRVDSYLLHADPLGRGYPIKLFQGFVTFDVPILGAMVTADSLTKSDKLLGSATTNYIPPVIYRGFEGLGFPEAAPAVSDTMEFSPDFRTLYFTFRTESMMDQIRIVTVANPEPSTALLAVFAAAFATLRRRR